MTNAVAPQVRSVYRAILRELPRHKGNASILSSPSPLQSRIRQYLSAETAPDATARARLEEAKQFTEYVRAQATYTMLLERYNPGMDMDEKERVRLTARRVGMDLPILLEGEDNRNGNGNGNGNGNKDENGNKE